MSYQQVCPGSRHSPCILFVEDIGTGEQIQRMGQSNHLDFQFVSHACLFEILPEIAVNQTYCWKILDSCEPELFQVGQKRIHSPERVSATNTGKHWRIAYNGEDLSRHFHDDLISISVRHQSGQ